MTFIIDQVEINGTSIEAILKIQGQISKWDVLSEREICSKAENKIISVLVENYLKDHLSEIMAKIDQQQIINMIVLNSARRVSP